MKESPCKDYHILMQAILDGVATPSDEAKWRAHAASCPACQALYQELVSLKKAMTGTVAEPPYGLDEAILKAIHTADKQKKLHTINRRQHLVRSFVGTAAAVAILVAGSWALTNYGGKAVDTADESAPMEMNLWEEESVPEAADEESEAEAAEGSALYTADIGTATESQNSASSSTGASPGASDAKTQTDRNAILETLQLAIAGLDLTGSYKSCMYLDCDNLPEGRDIYRVDPVEAASRTVPSPPPPSLTFYSTDDYLGFINGAGLELNFSLELTESEMQDCGLTTDGNLILIVVATPAA